MARRQRGFAKGGQVINFKDSDAATRLARLKTQMRSDPQHFAKGGPVRKRFKDIPIVREIQVWPRDKDGLYIQPDKNSPQLEIVMNHNRTRAANQVDLADLHGFGNPHTYDPKGDYECWDCNQRDKEDCLAVELSPGDMQDGSSCRLFEEPCAGDPEPRNKRISKELAAFGTDFMHEGFGCKRCPFYRKSKWVDSIGRDGWCGWMYFTTEPNVCCAINGRKTLPDGTPVKEK
jgi:hypothetical protein